MFRCVFALVTRGAMATMPVVQEEILPAQRRNAGVFKYPVGEVLVRGERCGRGVVLRIPRTSSRAEMKVFCSGRDAEEKPRSAVEVRKRQAEFGAGIFRVDRLVRIEAR